MKSGVDEKKLRGDVPASLFVLPSGPGDAAFNMAVDEVLLGSVVDLSIPVLRFYGWTQPAASFGYFQHYPDVERSTLLRPLVRRPTGGGIVPHDGDWTYSTVFSPSHPWYSFAAIESYRQIHEWIRRSFELLNVPTELATESRKAGTGQCFLGYEKFDLLWHGQKIAGAAQRRTKQGMLIQGSIQPPPIPVKREDWEAAMLKCIPSEAGKDWQKLVLDISIRTRADELTLNKYSQPEYNQKR